jgi:predicted SAM-dependent methyltransferase
MERAKGLIRLNLGCGLQTHPSWVNIDGSWNARLSKHPLLQGTLSTLGLISWEKVRIPWSSQILIHDIRKPLPFRDASASAVYASHVLEHLYREEGRQLMRESFRVLAADGILRVVVPDLRSIVEEYMGQRPFGEVELEKDGASPADRLNERLLMRWPSPSKRHILHRIYDASQDFHSHKWMYDTESLRALLGSAGFVDVQPKVCGDSLISDIAAIEDPSRLLNGAGICVEGRKPGLP